MPQKSSSSDELTCKYSRILAMVRTDTGLPLHAAWIVPGERSVLTANFDLDTPSSLIRRASES